MRLTLLLIFLIPFVSLSQYNESLGDKHFENGEYREAITEYKNALETVAPEYAKKLEIKIKRSEWCLKLRSQADNDFINEKYEEALSNYEEILNSSPKDEYAKFQIQKINKILYTPSLTLSSDNRSYNKNSRTFEIGFTTGNSTFVSATSEVSWIKVFAHQSKKVIEIILEQNKEEFDRVGKILVKATNEHNLVVEKKITITQEGDIEINISQTNFQFEASGGEKQVKIDSKTLDINFIDKPYWIKIEKANTNNDYTIKCERNEMPSSRSGLVSVKIGEQDFILAIGQEGNPKIAEKEFIKIKPKKLKLLPISSNTSFEIISNSRDLRVTSNSDWFTVNKSRGNSYVINFKSNYTDKKRKGEIIVKSKYSTKYVPVHQGKDKTTSKDKYIDVCFNCPKTKDIVGLNIGYANRQFDDYEGTQLGLKINPLLKYGFGINTGVNLESYWYSIRNIFKEPKPSFYNLNVPLHFEYRLNFSKWFNIYGYIGGGFNYQTTDFSDYFFPTTFEYGAGIRIGKVQTSIGWSEFITNFTKEAYPHDKVRNSKRFSIILSIMF